MPSSRAEPKAWRLAEREERIVVAARALAEREGWDSVTTRRLADMIGYSQPVLYSHFPAGKSQIVTAVALVGFEELATALSQLGSTPAANASRSDRVRAVVTTYIEYANRHSATYEAMFRLPIGAPFASPDTPRPMKDAFAVIVGALDSHDRSPSDLETAAEVLWATMHGVATLRRSDRFDPRDHERRIEQIVHLFSV